MMIHKLSRLLVLSSTLSGVMALAAVTAEEAQQLNTTLTPWGAEKAGSKDGLIPAYGNDVIKVPASYDPKKPGLRPDPFAKEKPLFVVNAANMAQYADKLTEGMKEALRKYPTMRMDVYPSHRTAVYPKYVVDNTIKNATACKTEQGGNKLSGCYGGLPFPMPKNGIEVVWNKLAGYTGHSWGGIASYYLVDPSGDATLLALNEITQESPFYDPKREGPAAADEVYWRARVDANGPARRVGEKTLIVDNIDAVGVGRKAWQYLPGQRRVKLSPGLVYDTPAPFSGGSANMDEQKVFLGAPDRYDWKLVGKRATFIPYNNFMLTDPLLCPGKLLLTKNHPNPDCVRWETHRTWVVEGTLKLGMRHIYSKRTLFIDEDVPGAAIGDNYDSSNKIHRVTFSSFEPMYEANGLMTDASAILDLATGSWVSAGLVGDYGGAYTLPPKSATYYSPEAMAGSGIR